MLVDTEATTAQDTKITWLSLEGAFSSLFKPCTIESNKSYPIHLKVTASYKCQYVLSLE